MKKTFIEWLRTIGSEPAEGFKYNTVSDMYRIELIKKSKHLLNGGLYRGAKTTS